MDPNFIKTGDNLSTWRKENHYTIKALSKAIGYDPTYISHVETKRYINERGKENVDK